MYRVDVATIVVTERAADAVQLKCFTLGKLRVSYPGAAAGTSRVERIPKVESLGLNHTKPDDLALSYEQDFFQ